VVSAKMAQNEMSLGDDQITCKHTYVQAADTKQMTWIKPWSAEAVAHGRIGFIHSVSVRR